MKKYLPILLFVSLICAFVAYCSTEDVSQAEGNDPKRRESSSAEIKSIDVDLTALSSTMAYAELFNILTKSDSYLGKTIKMRGSYYASLSDRTNQYYHLVIIGDVTACCEMGLEFVWNGEHTYPDDYPKENTRIEVVGVFKSDKELDQTHYYLEVDDISIL